ncbi:GntR family transcriptional regulator [Streptomyces luteoverticillatus]|uniref:GntR family transcriptional regulator n=1 Tax=Streptomyces luteoverticillatus TaxID=66425 RepID=A0A3S9PC64_STRLT|nr:TetR/AcrR family transcriptional regulator C-terminal domain-containing protein [Streptomyces luteoverticillatus]AZQ69989.1 GntR family transcriptional regulator [Streptomyces luteoverticillatus]
MNGQAAPRYTRIADELRQRIEAGELAPGDRVPSTREITRQWGVAMATATKVLTELRDQGLVRAVPGVGTVVEPAVRRPEQPAQPQPAPPRRKGTADQALTPARIAEVAVAVADVEGLAAASMRRVAAELEVATMSLYRHVADKDALLLEMMDAVFRRWSLPENPSGGWRERLELVARTLWRMFRRHPWLAPALSVTRPQMVAGALPFSEWALAALEGRGLDPSTAFTAHLTLFTYVRGTAVNVEMEAEAEALSGLDSEEWMTSQEPALLAALTGDRFPRMRHLATTGYDFDLDDLFEFGLQRLLDGLAVFLGEAP